MTIPQQIHSGQSHAAVVAATAEHIAFLDHEPVTPGHTLVCPVRMVASIFDLSDEERLGFLRFAEEVERVLRRELQPQGMSQFMNDGPFNELGHLHLHLVPRYEGDGFAWIAPNCRRQSVPELGELAEKLKASWTADRRAVAP